MALIEDREAVRLGQGAVAGKISRNVGDLTEQCFVILPDFSTQLEWGPCRWQSRDDVSLPGKGDDCLVLFDNDRRPWVVAWWPYENV